MVSAELQQQVVRKLMQQGILMTPELLDLLGRDQVTIDEYLDRQAVSLNRDVRTAILSVLDECRSEVAAPLVPAPKEAKAALHTPLAPRSPSPGRKTPHQEGVRKASAAPLRPSRPLPPSEILLNHNPEPTKKEVKDFVDYFSDRYSRIKQMLVHRSELEALASIRNVTRKKDRESVAIVGMVSDISETKNGNIILELEDPTGTVRVIVSKAKPDVFSQARAVVYDEVVGVNGFSNGEVIFATSLVFPDIPLVKEVSKAQKESYALFLGDIHIGSKYFMEPQFDKVVRWIRGEYGTDAQRRMAEKIEYIFLMGDNVEGVGIYPNQVYDLEVKDIYEQYRRFEDYVLTLPKNRRIYILPGNHDAARLSEPQPPLSPMFFRKLYDEDHIEFLSSPSYVRIGKDGTFPGFVVLLYHGYSFPYYAEHVADIRSAGGLERVDRIMQFLMQKRHLAPSHTSTLYVPGKEDNLVISPVPDIFASGHVHRTTVSSYRSVILINASCWIEETDYQRKVGLKPQPAKAIAVGLHDRQVRILNFN